MGKGYYQQDQLLFWGWEGSQGGKETEEGVALVWIVRPLQGEDLYSTLWTSLMSGEGGGSERVWREVFVERARPESDSGPR